MSAIRIRRLASRFALHCFMPATRNTEKQFRANLGRHTPREKKEKKETHHIVVYDFHQTCEINDYEQFEFVYRRKNLYSICDIAYYMCNIYASDIIYVVYSPKTVYRLYGCGGGFWIVVAAINAKTDISAVLRIRERGLVFILFRFVFFSWLSII